MGEMQGETMVIIATRWIQLLRDDAFNRCVPYMRGTKEGKGGIYHD